MAFALLLFPLAVSAAPSMTTHPPNDPAIYYSPFAWHVNSTSASTINSAAYCRFLFRCVCACVRARRARACVCVRVRVRVRARVFCGAGPHFPASLRLMSLRQN